MGFLWIPSKNLTSMVPKREKVVRYKRKNEVPIEYNRAKFASIVAKLQFHKAIEINKNFIVEQGMEYEVK